jgi:hypothetical protein
MMSVIIVNGDCELAFASLVGIAEKTNFLSIFLLTSIFSRYKGIYNYFELFLNF